MEPDSCLIVYGIIISSRECTQEFKIRVSRYPLLSHHHNLFIPRGGTILCWSPMGFLFDSLCVLSHPSKKNGISKK